MKMKVFWSETSINQLKNIYLYYKEVAGVNIAMKLKNKIIESTNILTFQPYLGAKEELLCHLPEEYRYLVEGNYKLIYSVENKKVIIHLVFDCRQNPDKLSENIAQQNVY